MAVLCPECGLILQTLDLPCPACVGQPLHDEVDGWTLHEYSKTFHNRRRYTPDPDALIAELNYWMATQPGLVGVAPLIHRDRQGAVKGVTLTCTASSRPAVLVFRFHRIKLAGSLGFKRQDLGAALNDWHDKNPTFERVHHIVLTSAGVPMECWVLSAGRRSEVETGNDPGQAPPVRLSRAVRLPAAALLWMVALGVVGAPLQASLGTVGSWLSVFAASLLTATVWVLVERRAARLGSKRRSNRSPVGTRT